MINNQPPVAGYPAQEAAKFVVLGSQQHGNGNVRYQIGTTIPKDASRIFNDQRSFDELRIAKGAQLANGLIHMTQGTEHLHLYGWAHDDHGNPLTFHFIVDNAPDGQITANIAAMSSDGSVGHYSGYLSHGIDLTDPSRYIIPVRGISLNAKNAYTLHGYEGTQTDVGFYVDELVVETGFLERTGANYRAQRDGDGVKVMPLREAPGDPYANHPIVTISAFDPLSRISVSMPSVQLPRGVVSGHIEPLAASPNSVGGFADR